MEQCYECAATASGDSAEGARCNQSKAYADRTGNGSAAGYALEAMCSVSKAKRSNDTPDGKGIVVVADLVKFPLGFGIVQSLIARLISSGYDRGLCRE
jgi:hypothetical protein